MTAETEGVANGGGDLVLRLDVGHGVDALDLVDGVSWLMVGSTQPVLMAMMVATAPRQPPLPRWRPTMDFVPFILTPVRSPLKAFFTALISATSPTRVEVACALM